MDDYISRQAALDAIEWKWAGKAAFDALKAVPSEDVQPVQHGHWIYTPTSPLGFTCSECGKEMCRFNYCPHCGAKIDEVTQ